jgi:hypothetical protein
MDGYPSWTGVYLVDAIARRGVEAAANETVIAAPLGWDCVGGKPLTELDDFLTHEGKLDHHTPQDVLDRHYAIYLLDGAGKRLHWHIEGAWQSVEAGQLPSWYPQPPESRDSLPAMPAQVKAELQKAVLAWDLRWDVMLRAMRAWVTGQITHALQGDSPQWLVLGTEPPTGRVFAGDFVVWSQLEATGDDLLGADGKWRKLDLSLDSANAALGGPLRANVVPAMVEKWFNLAWKQVAPEGSVSWASGARKWSFTRSRVTHHPDPLEWYHQGLYPRLLGWLFA